jgi:hypothetical protein
VANFPHPAAKVTGGILVGVGAIILWVDCDNQDQSQSTEDSSAESSTEPRDAGLPGGAGEHGNADESEVIVLDEIVIGPTQPVLVSEELDENGNVVHMTFAFPEEPSGTGGDDGQPNEENGWGGVPDVVMGDGKLEFRKPREGVYDLTKAEMLSRLKPRERAFSIDAVINPVPDEVGTASNVSHQISEQAGFTPPIPTDGTWNTFGAGSAVSERAGYTPPIPVWSAFGTDKA